MRESLEFAIVWTLVKLLGALPRPWARALGALIGSLAYSLLGRLRRVGLINLELAFPEKSPAEREQILRRLYRNLGWLLAEFCQMRALHARQHPRLHPLRRTRPLSRRPRPRQRRPHPHRPPRRMGALQLLPLAHGPSHEHGHPPPRQRAASTSSSTTSAACTATASCTRTTSPAACSPPCARAKPSASSWTPT